MAARHAVLIGCAAAYGLLASAAWAWTPFLLFFDSGSTRINPRGGAVLDNAARAIIDLDVRDVLIHGAADRRGSRGYNFNLARRRAEAVKAALVERGVPAARMRVESLGEDRPIVETADGIEEPQNRYADVLLREMCSPPPGRSRSQNC